MKIFGMEVTVLDMTKSTLGTVRHLWEGGHPCPAALIFLFSVAVPLVKLAMVLLAVWRSSGGKRGKAD